MERGRNALMAYGLPCSALAVGLMTASCGAEPDDDIDFRCHTGPSIETGLDFSLFLPAADSDDDPGPIADSVFEMSPSSGTGTEVRPGPGSSGPPLLTADAHGIVDADGIATCLFGPASGWGTQLRTPDGVVLYTVIGSYVFDGDVAVTKDTTDTHKRELLDERLAFTIVGDRVYAGASWKDDEVVIADANLQRYPDDARLLVVALIDGTCGSPGIVTTVPQ